NLDILRRVIKNPSAPVTNLEIDATAEEKKELGGEEVPKRRRSGRRTKTAEPTVSSKEIPSSAVATGELISVSDSDSSPRQEQE
ncbi:hypothetical protein KI387_001133, partial [Taxus chinensis]